MQVDTEYLKTLNLLYVEDEDTVRDLTANILKNFLNSIVVAKDGQEGLELFQNNDINSNNSFDVIITDINMPRLDGLSMIEEIRKSNRDIPIIITTAHDDPSFLSKSEKLNVQGYVSKPLNMSELIKNIANISQS
jgi:CheY-like chemotaxis protein